MFIKHLIQFPLFFPDIDGVGPPAIEGLIPAEEVEAAADEEVELEGEEEPSDEEETEEVEEEEKEEEAEEEEEQEEEEDDDEEEGTGKFALPEIKALKKDFPDLFKKHPTLRAAIFREHQFSEIFADPKEAESAAGAAATLNKLASDIVDNGDPENLFKTVTKNGGPEALDRLAKNLFPALQKLDKALYTKIASIPVKQVLRAALRDAKSRIDKTAEGSESRQEAQNLYYAAQFINEFAFEDTDVEAKIDGETEPVRKTKEQEEYEKKLAEFNERELTSAQQSINSTLITSLVNDIQSGLDPNKTLSPAMLKAMTNEVLVQLNTQVGSDRRHQAAMQSLWANARGKYDDAFKSKVINTSLARAKQIIPSLRAQVRKEFLGKSSVRVEKGQKKEVKRVSSTSKPGTSKSGKPAVIRDTNDAIAFLRS